MSERFQRRRQVRVKPVGDSVAAFVRERKALHVLNPTARLLLEYLAEPASRAELALMLREATDGDERSIRTDLDETLELFLAEGLIERLA